MQTLRSGHEAASHTGDLGLRVYSSRLLGRDKSLVLHGGGNTSVKVTETDLFGHPVAVIYIKDSSRDLETIGPAGLPVLSDPQMVNSRATHVTRACSPTPSIETILPFKFVDHVTPMRSSRSPTLPTAPNASTRSTATRS